MTETPKPQPSLMNTVIVCGIIGTIAGALLGYTVAHNAVDGMDMGLFAGVGVGFAIFMYRLSRAQNKPTP